MLQTPTLPKSRPLYSNPLDVGVNGMRSSQYPHYMSLPARYAGYPNYMQYRTGTLSDLEAADLSESNLRWSNFRGANLRYCKFTGSVLWGSTLTNADLSEADLCHADLTGVDLVGANLTNAKTEGACFLGARYSKSTCFPEDFGDPEAKGLIGLKESMQLQ
jgi:uncharacterized protein YjbI with pentapeptide repeats